MLKLYTFFRSSAAYRVRIALNHKGLSYEPHFVHFRKDGGQHKKPEYLALNPMGLVPALEDNGNALGQSLAIIEYLDEAYPNTAKLLPTDIVARAHVRAMAQAIACEIHPLNNLRVLNYLKTTLKHDEDTANTWYQHWVTEGFIGLEELVSRHAGKYCFGDTITMADVCLVPQVYNAKRFKCDMNAYPHLSRINDALVQFDAFKQAAPEAQPDAE
ncbi:MAG: maleylacetoacetate isomerase [Gammaproteobacteria bacterium]|nr:maleylacetoacetate isomerase [Gammaproteobacteria bacterium]